MMTPVLAISVKYRNNDIKKRKIKDTRFICLSEFLRNNQSEILEVIIKKCISNEKNYVFSVVYYSYSDFFVFCSEQNTKK